MALPSLPDIAKQLSESDIEQLLRLKRAGPKLQKLEAKRRKLLVQFAAVDNQIAEIIGEAAPKKRGLPRKPPPSRPGVAVRRKPNPPRRSGVRASVGQ